MHRHAKARIRNYSEFSQSIQPRQFRHGETKRTCLWLKNLPNLKPTDIVAGREQRVFRMPPGEDRWPERSRFFKGIAEAMADQWGRTAAVPCRLTAPLQGGGGFQNQGVSFLRVITPQLA